MRILFVPENIDTVPELWEHFKAFLYDNSFLWIILTALLFINLLYLLISTLAKSKRYGWNSHYFTWAAVFVLVWDIALMADYLTDYFYTPVDTLRIIKVFLSFASSAALLFIPLFLCFHVWRQVSYRTIPWYLKLFLPIPPLALSLLSLYNKLHQYNFIAIGSTINETLLLGLYYVYFFLIMIKTYQMLLSVFYQMPRHMQRSTKQLVIGVSFIVVVQLINMIFTINPPYSLYLLGAHIMMNYLYNGFKILPSQNVIASSRELIMDNLSTMVVVLSRQQRIVDWNQKTENGTLDLPKPQYREPFARYYQRIISEGNGRVSPHTDSVVITHTNDSDNHFLIVQQELDHDGRLYGYLVEISEVSQIYSVLRVFEDVALKDQLTGTFNRNGYMNQVDKLLDAGRFPLLIMVGDVDNLKNINDTRGHLVGDDILIKISETIKKHAPDGAFTARIGGDEFVMLFVGGTEQTATTFIHRVDNELRQDTSVPDVEMRISWGHAIYEGRHQNYNEIFNEADAMMYSIKKGRAKFRSSGLIPDPNTQKNA